MTILTDEQQQLRNMAGKLADEVYRPLAVEWDRGATFLPHDERKRLASLGFLGITLPEEYGGSGGELLDALIVIEELAKRNEIAAFTVFEANTGPARVIELFGTDEQKHRWLPPIIAGDVTMAIAISEPDAGSAATDLETTARREGDRWAINGIKRWCSGAGHAEQYLTYVRLTDERGSGGVGAIVVDRDTPGLTFGPQERLHGHRGLGSADMFFGDARVPADNLVIPAGGFSKLFAAFSIERLGNSTMSLALAQAALDRTANYVEQRRQFGKELIEFQAVQMALADMVVQVAAARLLIWNAARNAGRGVPNPLEASTAKCFSNEMSVRVTEQAMMLHGGYGMHPEYEVERLHRDAHCWAVAGGTPTIQRIRIASEYLDRRFDQRA